MSININKRTLLHAEDQHVHQTGPDALHGVDDGSKVTGDYTFISLRAGLALTVFDVKVGVNQTQPSFADGCVALTILFDATGESWICNKNKDVSGPILLRPGRSYCMIAPTGATGFNKISTGSRFRGLNIRIAPALWRKMGGELIGLGTTHPWTDLIYNDIWAGTLPIEANTRMIAKEIVESLHVKLSDIKVEMHCLKIIDETIDFLSKQKLDRPSEGLDARLAVAAEHAIAQDMSRNWRTCDLAKVCKVTEKSLGRSLRRVTGMTIYCFVQEIRLLEAKDLLENKCMPIAQIAERVGYTSHSHFSSLFRRRFGICPSGLR